MNYRTYELECQREGHLPADVEHLRGHYTRLTCPRCKKSVIEHGLGDHPDSALAKAPPAELSPPFEAGKPPVT